MRYATWGAIITVGLCFVVLATDPPLSRYVLGIQLTSLIGQLVSGYFWWKDDWVT